MTGTEARKNKQVTGETGRSRHILRRIGAVLAGVIVVVTLDVGIDVIMHATGIYPSWFKPMSTRLWLLAIGYRMVDGVMAGYIVARLAPDRPVTHAVVFGLIGVVMSIAGVIGTWNRGPEFGPKWYPLALVAIALPCAWVGGSLRARQIALLQNRER
jgi:peptidoglycan/LPS O-acetylase OafA/YrhL